MPLQNNMSRLQVVLASLLLKSCIFFPYTLKLYLHVPHRYGTLSLPKGRLESFYAVISNQGLGTVRDDLEY